MAKDALGNCLRVNDIVTMRCRVTGVFENDKGTNMLVDMVDGPEDDRKLNIDVNSQGVELLKPSANSSWEV